MKRDLPLARYLSLAIALALLIGATAATLAVSPGAIFIN
jgi:hypothetical protein